MYSQFMMHGQKSIKGLLIIETSRSYTDTPHSVGLLWTSDRPDAAHNTHNRQTSIPLAGCETTVP